MIASNSINDVGWSEQCTDFGDVLSNNNENPGVWDQYTLKKYQF